MAHTAQERYSNLVLAKLRNESIFIGLFNRRYEGTPTAGAVKIPVRDTEVAIGTYNKAEGGTLSTGTTTYKTLNIDKDKYVNELIDGFDSASVPDNLVADRLDSAGYTMADTLDTELISAAVTGGTALKSTTALTPSTVYNAIVDAVQTAKAAKVKTSEMWLAVSNTLYGTIIKSPEFISASSLGDEVKTGGFVGRIAGVAVYESANMPDGVEFVLGNNVFCHYVDEWLVPVSINDLKDGKHIGASAVQGRRVYGIMISRPTTVLVKKTA